MRKLFLYFKTTKKVKIVGEIESQHRQQIPQYDIQNQETINVIKPQQLYDSIDKSLPQILLTGTAGVGKTRLFHQLQLNFEQNSINGFQTLVLKDFVVVDTPSFELDESIEVREERISQFQKYLIENKNSISTFAIVVNFERTDLMKKKITSVYKYLRKVSQQKIIIVTDWELSENKEQSIKHLQQQLKIFKCDLLFVEKTTELIETLRAMVFARPIKTIDLQETIFEVYDENSKESQMFQQQLQKIVGNEGFTNQSQNIIRESQNQKKKKSNKQKIKEKQFRRRK